MAEKKVKAKKSTAKKVTELMELQNIVIQMHKRIEKIDSDLKKVLHRMGL